MAPLAPGTRAPRIDGVDFAAGPTALFFYKVTCPVCQAAAPTAQAFEEAYPGRIVGVGEDPQPNLRTFSARYGMSFPSVPDLPPYELSEAYGLEVVPTLFLVDRDGVIVESVPSWDREGYNRISRRLADLAGSTPSDVAEGGDGLPNFRPG